MRYEIRTLPIGVNLDDEYRDRGEYLGRVVQVLNVRPELNQFRALVEVFDLAEVGSPEFGLEGAALDEAVWAGEEE